MESLPLLFLGCLAGLSLPMLFRHRTSSRKTRALLPDDELLRLSPGAVIQHGGQDLTVTMAGRLAAAGPWEQLLFLESGQRKWLLLVAAKGQAERLWLLGLSKDPVPQPVGSQPAPGQSQVAGLRYLLAERHLSTVAFVGRGEEAVRLDGYRGPGARRLVLLRIGSAETGQGFVGEVVAEAALQVLPATSDGAPGR